MNLAIKRPSSPTHPWRSHRLGKPLEDGLDLAIVVHRRPHDLDVEREEGVNVCFCWNSRG